MTAKMKMTEIGKAFVTLARATHGAPGSAIILNAGADLRDIAEDLYRKLIEQSELLEVCYDALLETNHEHISYQANKCPYCELIEKIKTNDQKTFSQRDGGKNV